MANKRGQIVGIVAAIALFGCLDTQTPNGWVADPVPPQTNQEPGQCFGGWQATSAVSNSCQNITATANLQYDNFHGDPGWTTQLDGTRVCLPGTPWQHNAPDHVASPPLEISFSSPVTSVLILLYVSGAWVDDTECANGVDASGTLTVYGENGQVLSQSELAYDPVWRRMAVTYIPPDGISRITSIRYEPGPQHQVWQIGWDYTPPPPPPPPPCLTGDSILDTHAMRDLLRVSWDSSNAFDPVLTNRRERGGVIFKNPATGEYKYLTDFDPDDKPCKAYISPDSILGTPVAVVHTHPWKHLEETTGACSPAVPGVKKQYDAKKYLGPSDDDIITAQTSGFNIPYYVMDKENIYVIPPGTTLKNFKSRIKSFSRQGPGGCTRP